MRWALDVSCSSRRHYEVFLVNDSAVLSRSGSRSRGGSDGIATPTRSWSPGGTSWSVARPRRAQGREGAYPSRESDSRAAAGVVQIRPPRAMAATSTSPRGAPSGRLLELFPEAERCATAGPRARALADRLEWVQSTERDSPEPQRCSRSSPLSTQACPGDLSGAVPSRGRGAPRRGGRPGAISEIWRFA